MAKTQIKNYIFKPGIGVNDNSFPDAYSLITANKSFIQKESTAWIADQVAASAAGFVGYTYNASKCERDVGYNIDAYLKDLRYGGNENTRNTIKYYWDQDVAQIDGDRQPEIQTYGFIKTLINTYILQNSLYTASNTEVTQTIDNTKTAETQAIANVNLLLDNTIDVITNGLTSLPALVNTGVGTVKIQGRYSVDELLLISNATRSEIIYNFTNINTGATVHIKDNGTDEDFVKYLQTTDAVTTIQFNYNTSTHSATDDIQIFVEEKEVRTRPFDFGTDAIERPRAALPVSMLDADFEYGLQPTKWSAIGTMRGYPSVYEIPGTDASVSKVVTDASLSEPTEKFTAEVRANGTSDWVWSVATDRLGGANGNDPSITIIEGDTLTITNYAGASHPFYIKTTPNTGTSDLVTTVINNGSVNTASPITWATQAGDAGVYYYQCSNHAAMGGTITVLANDQGTGIGQSLITVTTEAAHGFESGTPVSIKALENSIAGASRAEGTFITVNIPSSNTFQYYAKAKVGTVAGQVLSTGYTQLREAGFYTGASIGAPEFTISSNGSSGTMFAQLGVLPDEVVIPFDGPAPEIGSPLAQANIPLGSQVTGIVDTSAGGGTYVSPETDGETASGQNQMTFKSVAGIVDNLAIDRGDGNAIYITSIDGNTATFNGNFTSNYIGNRQEYSNIPVTNDAGIGQLAEFDISYADDSSFTYVISAIENDGIDYQVGDKITISGADLGGTSPANDATITVETVGSDNSIASASITGTHFNNDIYLIGQSATYTGGLGTGATFDVTYLDGIYTVVDINSPGADYKAGDMLSIAGNVLVPGLLLDTKDLFISVDTVESTGGQVLSASRQVGGTGYTDAQTVSVTGGSGSGLTLIVSVTAGEVISATIDDAGSGYTQFDVVTLLAGGNDCTFRIDDVKEIGGINTVTFAGDAPSANKTFTSVPFTTTSASGTDAVIDIEQTGASYVATFTNEGSNYLPTESITISGTEFGGTTPANDATIVIDNVGGTGNITEFTVTGTALNGDSTTGSPGSNLQPTGGSFNVSQNTDGSYVADLGAPGTGYNVGQVHTIPGTLFGGESPTNDVSITILSIDDLVNGAVLSLSASGTGYIPLGAYLDISGTNNPALGAGSEFNLIRDIGGYSNFVVATAGANYAEGDRVAIDAGQVGGVSPLNDITITVNTVDGTGGILTFSPDFIEAGLGDNVDLISTVTMTEATTGNIASGLPITYSAIATLQAEFVNAHGLVPGDTFITSVDSDDGSNNHNLAAGSYIATEVPTSNSLRFNARTVGSIDITQGQIVGDVYPRPDSFFVHRPFDGGVQLGTGGPQHGSQAIRQSKKYIRYQSGKGIMYTTGALFAPSYDLRSVTATDVEVGSEITIITDDNDHGVQVGGVIRLLGVETPGYNSGPQTAVPPTFDYTVTEVVDERTFKVLSQRRLGSTDAVLGFGAQMSVISWHGATVRSGIFDDQNGIFWEFDGTQISVVQRTGTFQVSGTIAIDVDNNLVTGTNTRFRDQLKAGDRVIIRGMTHVISHVIDQDTMTVTPDFRGVTNVIGAKAMLIVDKKTKQSDFNLDRLDGSGPSGYDIDIAKMQMIGIQYSWYGAGFIDFMLRGADGNFIFAHRMRNSNVNTEAFMRSGNLPVRYEVTNEGPPGKLKEAMNDTQTTVVLEDGSFFPTSGYVYIDNEIVQFTGRSGHTLTGCIRSATFTNFQGGATRSYTAGPASSHDSRTGVILISQTITPLISHWGSAFITDGGFDEDRGYIFSYAESQVSVSTTKQTAFMIRLAPSVSNAIVGDLGERELLNRAQLLLQGLEITSNTGDGEGIVIEGVLNPQNYPLNPDSVGWSGLSSVAQGGQPSFAQIASGGAIEWTTGEAAVTTNPTTQAFPQGTISLVPYWWNGRYVETGRDYVLLLENNYQNYINAGMSVGDTFSHPDFTDTTIRTFSNRFNRNGTLYRWMYLNRGPNSTSSTNNTATVSKVWKTANTSQIWFEQSEFSGSNVQIGTSVTDGIFPAGTLVNSIQNATYFATSYVVVTFNNTSDGTSLTPGTTTIEFTFVEPPFGQPGETVFSFIANPGERSTLNLSELKELTNTPLGGRGTFPNGPDVLAINVYKVAGTDTNANIILRWGEAQA